MQTHIHAGILLGVIVLAGCTATGTGATPNSGDADVATGTAEVNVTDAGFTPQTITVERGTTATWVNQRDRPVWPASTVHPTHTEYPGGDYDAPGSYTGSQGCSGPGEQKGDAFDACQEIAPDGTWSFTFDRTGTWDYHDHLRPSAEGTVIVVD